MHKLLIFLVISLFLTACSSEINQNKTFCKAEQRNAALCYTVYSPVCGWFNENIKCFKYPCAATYSNDCNACKDEKVLYYTEGECPK